MKVPVSTAFDCPPPCAQNPKVAKDRLDSDLDSYFANKKKGAKPAEGEEAPAAAAVAEDAAAPAAEPATT